MGLEMEVELLGATYVSKALQNAQKTLKKDTVPIMEEIADSVASRATARAVPHPSGLYRMRKRADSTPLYFTEKVGPYCFKVSTKGPGEAISEFARLSVVNQGTAMVTILNDLYGRGGGSGGGRILWATMDDMAGSINDQIQAAVDAAAKDIEQQMGSV